MFKMIIWATDGSEAADRALPVVKSLAAGEGRSLVVVHSKEHFLGGRATGYPVRADEDELQAKVRAQVEALEDEGFEATLRVVTGPAGHAAHMIADVADELGADVIVVGTRGHGPVAGLLLGSVTQRLLHIAPCPVLAVPAMPELEAREKEAAPPLAATH